MSLMGIDIGTSCCKASVFRADGEMIHCARRRYELQRDNSGGVVLPSEEVWRKRSGGGALCRIDGGSGRAV